MDGGSQLIFTDTPQLPQESLERSRTKKHTRRIFLTYKDGLSGTGVLISPTEKRFRSLSFGKRPRPRDKTSGLTKDATIKKISISVYTL